VGSAGSDGVLLKKADFVAGFYEIIGAGQTDNPAADNENITAFFHVGSRLPLFGVSTICLPELFYNHLMQNSN
jgi:hypothetical protein